MIAFTRSRVLLIVGLILILALLSMLVYERLSPQGIFSDLKNDLKAIDPGEGASYTDLDGNPIDLKDFKGKPLIINSWASWSPFSAAELALLSRTKDQYGDRVQILAINRKEEVPMIRAYISAFGIPANIIFVNDMTDHFYKAVGGYAMPETIFYAPDGRITFHKRGVLTEEEVIQYTDAITKE